MSLAAVAEAALAQAAEALTLRQESGATYDATTRTLTGGSTTATATEGVVTGFDAFEVNGVSVELGDLKVEMPAATLTDATITPAVGDHIQRGSTLYRVVGIKTRRVGSETVAYQLHIRGVQ